MVLQVTLNYCVHYLLVKVEDPNTCGETNPVADETSKELLLPKDATAECKWNITTTTRRTIQLSWPTGGTQEDCVNVEGPGITEDKKEWCANVVENRLSKAYITVTRKTPKPPPEKATDIKLLYQLVNDAECSTDAAKPTEEIQSFGISKQEKITAGTACVWAFQSTTGKSLQLSLEVNPPDTKTQCVKVAYADGTSSSAAQQICGEEGKNLFTADVNKAVIVKFESPSGPSASEMKNFKVYYQLVNDNRCSDMPNPPTDKTQSFSVAKSGNIIPAGLLCAWSLPTTGGKKIRVTLDVDSTKTKNQCVTVTEVDKTKPTVVCGKEQQNKFVSTGNDVVITYGEQKTEKTDVANFKIFYQFGGWQRSLD
ncbi:unnamed protein product [Echinostoma caproni]|uniref:CUB domain-containing protein n=1 Tax=Echinostoma caproni TaxID=27848 RepID=A0A183B8W3_9TREM|nr:unnamed protein product [Echinostoma caproni]